MFERASSKSIATTLLLFEIYIKTKATTTEWTLNSNIYNDWMLLQAHEVERWWWQCQWWAVNNSAIPREWKGFYHLWFCLMFHKCLPIAVPLHLNTYIYYTFTRKSKKQIIDEIFLNISIIQKMLYYFPLFNSDVYFNLTGFSFQYTAFVSTW